MKLLTPIFAIATLLGALWVAHPSQAQDATLYEVVTVCGTPNTTYVAGYPYHGTMDVNGKICTVAAVSAGGGGDASAANQTSQITQETAINTVLGTVTASPTANTIGDRLKTLNTTTGALGADGGLATIGLKADAKSAATDTTSASAISIWKEISYLLQNTQSGGGSTKVTINTPPNDVIAGPTGFTSTNTLAVNTQGSGAVGIQATGTGSGLTFSFQGTANGTTWFNIPCGDVAGNVVNSGSANGQWVCPVSGWPQARVNLTAISGGTETFTLNASAGSASLPLGTQGTATNLTGVNGTAMLTGGVAGSQGVGGLAANNASASGNPVPGSCLAVSAETTAATNGQNAECVTDLVHKQIVLPYANPENFVTGTTAAMTGTTSTVLLASPGGSLRNYVTTLTCVNSHATVGTFVTVQDGSGGTAIYTLSAASVYGGSTVTFTVPLKQPTTATGLYVADATTGANVICSSTGYKGL